MAYPAVARCANLPTDIWNSEQFGGGYIIGWLPIIHHIVWGAWNLINDFGSPIDARYLNWQKKNTRSRGQISSVLSA
jgi:hypothetical protein